MIRGAYNLTLSIVVNSIITLCFCIMITFATYKRAQWRKTFREEVAKAGEVKRAPRPEKKDAPKSEKSGSDSKPLIKDAAPVGTRPAKETTWTPSEANKPAPRNYQGQGQSQLYGGNAPSGGAQVARSNSGRYPGGPVRGSREQYEDPLARYRDDSADMTDYSRPPLTASTTTDPYYGGRYDTTQTYDEYPSSQGIRAAYQEPRPLQPIAKRNNSSTPAGTAYRGGLERSAPPPKLTTMGLGGSGPSSRSSSGSNTPSPVDRYGRRGANSPVAPIEMEQYPAQVTRSNSNRIPPQMRGGYV
ncbi:hypothetical protein BGZ58_004559 [Dissophora ornata]|nr:hypothetical protein BGZ58_004559 [Dissophora ornata]